MSDGSLWESATGGLNDALNLYGKYESIRTGSGLQNVTADTGAGAAAQVRPEQTSAAKSVGGTMAPGSYQGQTVAGIPKTAVLIGGGILAAVALYFVVKN